MLHPTRTTRPLLAAGLLALVLIGVSACGGRAYVYERDPMVEIRSRAETQSEGTVRVSASVPGEAETERLFGVPLYDQGIQPVWIEIENSGPEMVRYALVGTDRFYFSPLEVAYKNRGPFSEEGRDEMQRNFYSHSMPRYVDPGETRSGFVFTHASLGAKGFNVDVFGDEDTYHFSFLMRVPGFVPDYANVDFESIYDSDEIAMYDEQGIYAALQTLGCCSTDEDDESTRNPINLVLVGEGAELLIALLRSGWTEMSAEGSADADPHFFFGRKQDAIFRYQRKQLNGYYEMRLWLAPMLLDEERVWIGEIKHVLTHRWIVPRDDPDVDEAREFFTQNLWYSQTLLKLGRVSGQEIVPIESIWADLNLLEADYFTDGYRNVYWLSSEPVSLHELKTADWQHSGLRRK